LVPENGRRKDVLVLTPPGAVLIVVENKLQIWGD
jgi:hypothetical protein